MHILYEDVHLIVCRKKAGTPVQSASVRTMDMVSELKTYLRENNPGGRMPELHVVHRLDQGVGGILVFAKDKMCAAALSKQIRDGRMEKEYLALTDVRDRKDHPLLDGADHKLTDWLKKDERQNLSRVVPAGSAGAKKAELICRCIASEEPDCALLEIHLLTGRHHQIRVQLANAGLPIIGDRKYGHGEAAKRTKYPCLYACALEFVHPVTKEKMCWKLEKDEVLRCFGGYAD